MIAVLMVQLVVGVKILSKLTHDVQVSVRLCNFSLLHFEQASAGMKMVLVATVSDLAWCTLPSSLLMYFCSMLGMLSCAQCVCYGNDLRGWSHRLMAYGGLLLEELDGRLERRRGIWTWTWCN